MPTTRYYTNHAKASCLKKGTTDSCGCQTPMKRSLNARKEFGEAAFQALYMQYKRNATYRNHEFSLDEETFRQITKMKCFYCGKGPSQISKSRFNNGDYVYNGIDRIDSSMGYIESNVVPCCGQCNYAKRDLNIEEFYQWITNLFYNMLLNKE